MESLRKNLSAYTLDDAPEDVRELYKDEFIQLYASSIKCFFRHMKMIGHDHFICHSYCHFSVLSHILLSDRT